MGIIRFCIFIIFLLLSTLYSFEVTTEISVISSSIGELTAFDLSIKNSGTDTLNLTMIKDSIQTPDSWIASFCVGTKCFPDFIDTTDFSIPPNDSVKVTLDVTPLVNLGWGYNSLEFQNTDNSSEYKKFFFATTTNTANNILSSSKLKIERENGLVAYDLFSKEGAFHKNVINTSTDTLYLKIIKEAILLPSNSSFSLCANTQCYPPFQDTLPVFTLAPADTLKIDMDYSTGSTSGTILEKVTVIDETDSLFSDDMYGVIINSSSGIIFASNSIDLRGIKFNGVVNGKINIIGIKNNENITTKIYSLNGVLVQKSTSKITKNILSENVSNLSTGRYVVMLENSNFRLVATFNIIK